MYKTNFDFFFNFKLSCRAHIHQKDSSQAEFSSGLIESNQAAQLQLLSRQPAGLSVNLKNGEEQTHETHPAMTLQLKTKARLFDLHCSVGLTDWDMDKELKLATTTDQFYHGDCFLSLWCLVSLKMIVCHSILLIPNST